MVSCLKRVSSLSSSFCAIAVATLLTSSASATKWECGERSNLPLEGKNYCAGGDFRQSEINLGKVFAALLEKQQIVFGDADALRLAQSAFESYRDNHCVADSKRLADKLFHPMIVAQCKSRLTNLRIAELKRMHEKIL